MSQGTKNTEHNRKGKNTSVLYKHSLIRQTNDKGSSNDNGIVCYYHILHYSTPTIFLCR